jgi:Tfp pilus assembly protein PilO
MINQYIKNLNRRTKVFSGIVVFILIVIILDRLLFSHLYHSLNKLDEELSLKKDLLTKYYSTIAMKETYKKRLNELKASYNSIEKRLFLYGTVDLAQAKLQEFVKNVAMKNGIIVSRSSAKKGEIINENPFLMLIYGDFEINDIDKIEKLQSFLHNIEHINEKLIFVDDLKIKGTGFDMTKGVSISIKLFTIAKLEV